MSKVASGEFVCLTNTLRLQQTRYRKTKTRWLSVNSIDCWRRLLIYRISSILITLEVQPPRDKPSRPHARFLWDKRSNGWFVYRSRASSNDKSLISDPFLLFRANWSLIKKEWVSKTNFPNIFLCFLFLDKKCEL